MRYWEDFAVGDEFELGTTKVTAEAIVEFARQWDPQPFHLDDELAAATPYGGLIASGWHTASIFMRMYVDAVLLDSSGQGGSGLHELRWLKPVRPGDTLSGRATVTEVRASSRRPERGTVEFVWELRDQEGDVVLRMLGSNLFGRRHPA